MSRAVSSLVLVSLLVSAQLLPATAAAEFHRWTDPHGRQRVSNVAPAALGADGRPRSHPWSVQSQHQHMRAELLRQAAALSAQEAAASSAESRRRKSLKALFDGMLDERGTD